MSVCVGYYLANIRLHPFLEKYTDDDIRWLLDRVGSFLVEGLEGGRSVYRLYHQALTDHLRHPAPVAKR